MIDINKYKFFVRNFSITDDELTNLINMVITDIAKSTKIFKDIIGFSIIKDFYDYDFELIMKMNDKVREDVGYITIGEFNDEDIINCLSGDNTLLSLSPEVTYNEYMESPLNRMLLSVDDVVTLNKFSNDYISVFNIFSYISGFKYRLNTNNILFDQNKESKQALAIVSVVPDLDNIDDEIISLIEPALVEGLKYFTQIPYTNSDDMQSTSIILNRYNYEKQKLMDLYQLTDAKFYKKAWL